jgi:hypothetical protein
MHSTASCSRPYDQPGSAGQSLGRSTGSIPHPPRAASPLSAYRRWFAASRGPCSSALLSAGQLTLKCRFSGSLVFAVVRSGTLDSLQMRERLVRSRTRRGIRTCVEKMALLTRITDPHPRPGHRAWARNQAAAAAVRRLAPGRPVNRRRQRVARSSCDERELPPPRTTRGM